MDRRQVWLVESSAYAKINWLRSCSIIMAACAMRITHSFVRRWAVVRLSLLAVVLFAVSPPCDGQSPVAEIPVAEIPVAEIPVAEIPVARIHGRDHSSSLHSLPGAPPVVLPERYQLAVKNAKDATAKNVSRELVAIVSGNEELIWKIDPKSGERRVLVVTWTTHDSYFQKPGSTYVDNYETWVTAAPQLKKFCQSYQPGEGDPPLARRLEQLLGLPPNSGHKFVVELWVPPSALFRPSADPGTTDYEAQLQFPDVNGYVAVSDRYKQWYIQSEQDRYQPKTGPAYPWTRLGYTYDWGNPKSRVGLSEFVFRAGNELTVHSVSTTEDYAKTPNP